MKRSINYLTLLKRLLPLFFAGWAVWNETAITAWIERRESALLVGVFLLLSALLHPRLQRGLIITLAYGVAFLALREAFRVSQYPPPISAPLIATLRGLLLLAAFSCAIAGAIHESIEKRSMVGRRYYTGAGAIYFLDHGLITLFWAHSWQSLVFVFSGVTCALGAIFAEKFALAGTVEIEAPPTNVATTNTHLAALKSEWRDTTEESLPPSKE